MARLVFAALAGGIFGFGLILSGMTDTRRVIGWLDLFGDWDPTLAFVMGGAILPMAAAWAIAGRQRQALLGSPLPPRPVQRITPELVFGSVLFGIGWGLVGLCPGPAMASIAFGGTSGAIFLAAMIAGMVAARPFRGRAVPPAS